MSLPALKIGDLTCRIPIIQGGMGIGVSLSGLASAVAQQGGIGVIAGAMTGISEPDASSDSTQADIRALKREIQTARSNTDGVLGVNIMVALNNYADLVRTSISEGIDVIFSGAGLPMDLPGYLTEGARTKLVPIVSSARAAALLCKSGSPVSPISPMRSSWKVPWQEGTWVSRRKSSTIRSLPWKTWFPKSWRRSIESEPPTESVSPSLPPGVYIPERTSADI